MNLNVKKWLCISAGFGAGAVLMVALLLGGIAWYSSRPKPWNTNAIRARYASLETTLGLDSLPVAFSYDLENRTDTNYRIGDGSGLEVMARLTEGNVLSQDFASHQASSASVSGPSFIPPKGVGRITVRVVYKFSDDFTPIDKSDIKKVSKYLNRRIKAISGFVIFDQSSHYQIDLPSGWSDLKSD